MAKPAKWPSTRLSAIPSVVQRVHQRPATSSCHQTVSSTPTTCALPPNRRRSNRWRLHAPCGLNELGPFYNENHLRPNPAKTQLTAFHLKNHQADRKLNVTWNGTKLDHTHSPVYLGITLDRSLTYRNHALPQDARKTLLQKQPPQEAAWYELGRVPPHQEDDGDSTMSLRGGVLLSCLGPFHASQARRHNVK